MHVDEEQGIYRGEVTAIMLALADINANVNTIVGYIERGDDEEEEDQETDA